MSLMDVAAVAELPAVSPQLEGLVNEVLKFQVNSTTPLDAMMKIAQWQETLSQISKH